ncbi:unnamed protein product [Phytomonas sp. Hart1]|nr:unnamed protein product [Phytomonas sp. Hart1]|eukprot:CCW71950.1 unnamed protein product [Phytomonas sp. isolate Hart1]
MSSFTENRYCQDKFYRIQRDSPLIVFTTSSSQTMVQENGDPNSSAYIAGSAALRHESKLHRKSHFRHHADEEASPLHFYSCEVHAHPSTFHKVKSRAVIDHLSGSGAVVKDDVDDGRPWFFRSHAPLPGA